ncbi:MAG: hypothetical protein U0Q12_13440 [Vicinamibacterales bacterium]
MFQKALILGPGKPLSAPPASAAACATTARVLSERGVSTVVIGSSASLAGFGPFTPDQFYWVPVHAPFIESVIVREQPDVLLWTYGDGAAQNTVIELEQTGVLARYGVQVVPRPERLKRAEDPDHLAQLLRPTGLRAPRHRVVSNILDARDVSREFGFPVAARPLAAPQMPQRHLVTDEGELDRALDVLLAQTRYVVLRPAPRLERVIDVVVLRDAAGDACAVGHVEHLESALAERGDATLVCPPIALGPNDLADTARSACEVVRVLELVGLVTVRLGLDTSTLAPLVRDVFVRPSMAAHLVSIQRGGALDALGARLLLGESLADLSPGGGTDALDYRTCGRRAHSVVVGVAGRAIDTATGLTDAPYAVVEAHSLADGLAQAIALSDRRVPSAPRGGDASAALVDWLRLGPLARWQATRQALQTGARDEELIPQTGIAPPILGVLRAAFARSGDRSAPTGWHPTDHSTELAGRHALFSSGAGSLLVLGDTQPPRDAYADEQWCLLHTAAAVRRAGGHPALLHHDASTLAVATVAGDAMHTEVATTDVLSRLVHDAGVTSVLPVSPGFPVAALRHIASLGVKVLGSSLRSVERAHDALKLAALLESLDVPTVPCARVTNLDDALGFADRYGFPLLVQDPDDPRADVLAATRDAIRRQCRARRLSPAAPVALSSLAPGGRLLEVDGVAAGGRLVVAAVSEHVEPVGSGSAMTALVLPPQRTYPDVLRRARHLSAQIAQSLDVIGPFALTLLVHDNDVRVVRVRLRPSRNVPFISRVLNVDLVDVATRVMLGQSVPSLNGSLLEVDFVGVMLRTAHGGSDTDGHAVTASVSCYGDDMDDALLKAFMAADFRLPLRTVLLSADSVEDRVRLIKAARILRDLGARVLATDATAECLRTNGLDVTTFGAGRLQEPASEGASRRRLDLVVSLSSNPDGVSDVEERLRRQAIDRAVPLIVDAELATRLFEALGRRAPGRLTARSWTEYQGRPEVDVYASRE